MLDDTREAPAALPRQPTLDEPVLTTIVPDPLPCALSRGASPSSLLAVIYTCGRGCGRHWEAWGGGCGCARRRVPRALPRGGGGGAVLRFAASPLNVR